ncbi:dihydrofolate reductase [Anguillid herpesvirus 1]|nr:dihydrofolate reductase [Anguillid herpesvirus 1]
MELIVARNLNGAIGRGGRLLYKLPKDLQRFRDLTQDQIIVMGRKTFETLPRVLPRRRHVVLSKSAPAINIHDPCLQELATNREGVWIRNWTVEQVRSLESLPRLLSPADKTRTTCQINQIKSKDCLYSFLPAQARVSGAEIDKTARSKLFIIGGAEVYNLFWKHCSVLHITKVVASEPKPRHEEEDLVSWAVSDSQLRTLFDLTLSVPCHDNGFGIIFETWRKKTLK